MELSVPRRTHVLTLEILYVFDEVERAQRLGEHHEGIKCIFVF